MSGLVLFTGLTALGTKRHKTSGVCAYGQWRTVQYASQKGSGT